MRRLYIGLMVAVTTVFVPFWAMASNQQVAERIAANLRKEAELHHYRIGVKFQNGTAWLKGHVAEREQIKEVLSIVAATAGVERVVNNLNVKPLQSKTAAAKQSTLSLKMPGGSTAPENLTAATATNHAAGQKRFSGNASNPALRLQQVVDEETAHARTAQAVPISYKTAPARRVSASIAQPQIMAQQHYIGAGNRPLPIAYRASGAPQMMPAPIEGAYQGQVQMPVHGNPMPMGSSAGVTPARYDQPHMPNYAWPSYAAYPNYAAVTYPRQYSPTAWPYIGPFYPYPQVPLGWRKVTLEWDDGWWMLDFKDTCCR